MSLTLIFTTLFLITLNDIIFITSTSDGSHLTRSATLYMGLFFSWFPSLLVYYYAAELNIESYKFITQINSMRLSEQISGLVSNSQIVNRPIIIEPLEITLSNTFTLDRKFLPSFIFSVFTFSVMLIQLHISIRH